MLYADLDYGIWSGWLYFPITLSPTATPGVPRYVNVLFDGNGSGVWCDVAGEWIVRNFPLPSYGIVHNPGQTVWYCLGGFTGVTDFSGIHWVRITLSDVPIPANVPNGWDGRYGPSFAFGETEDWQLTWYYNPNPPPPPDPPVPPVPPFNPLNPNPPAPVPDCKKTASIYQVPPPTHEGHEGNFNVRVKNTSKNHPIHIEAGPFITDLNGDPVYIQPNGLVSAWLQPGQWINGNVGWMFENHGENHAWGNIDVVVDPQGTMVVVANLGNYRDATSQQPTGISIEEVTVPTPALRGTGLIALLVALCLAAVLFILRRKRFAEKN